MKPNPVPFLLAALSGILTALSFPKFNLSFLIWVSLIPLLFLVRSAAPKRAFFLGLVSGFFYYAILLYWIPYVPAHYGDLSLGLSIIIYLLFVLLLSLFWGVFGFVLARIHVSFPGISLFVAPLVWTALEYILTFFLTGFPWGLLGYSQVHNLPILQTAAVGGVYGLSLMIVFFQSMFVLSLVTRKRAPFFCGLSLILLLHLAGFLSMGEIVPTEETFTAAVIQGNVSSDIYWEEVSAEEILKLFDHHLELTRQAWAQGGRLVIWPEFSVPLCFSCPEPLYQLFKERLQSFVNETKTTFLLGTNETAGAYPGVRYYNTALCLSPDLTETRYAKMHLVPFGEYTPYKKFLSFIETVTHAIGDITPGTEHVLHEYNGIPFGSPICYEIIFPDLVRRFVKKGARFLVTITNDGWYGTSSAPHQHFLIAVFRAVENRRFLLRAATTGVSGIIDPYGRVLSRSELMTSALLMGSVTPRHSLTFYSKYGDVLPRLSLTISAFLFILALAGRKR